MLKPVLDRLKAFRDETRGSLSVEAVFAFPMLLWALTATYTFFDAYKVQNTAYRANYTISDMLSRQTDPVDADFLDGLYRVFRYIARVDADSSWIRVSVVQCMDKCADETNRVLQWDWSKGVGGARDLDSSDLEFYRDVIPLMAKGDRLILVETSVDYQPPFAQALVSFSPEKLVSHVVTRPRFAPQLKWSNG